MPEKKTDPDDAIVKVTIRIQRGLWKAAKRRAIDDDVGVQVVAVRAIEAYLDEAKRKKRGKA